MLSRSDILSKNELKKIRVSVPAWGGDVFVSEFSADVKDSWEQKLIEARENGGKLPHARAVFIVMIVVDEKGNFLFTDKDIPAIAKLSAIALDDIVEKGQKLNGLGGGIEDVKKN